MEKSTRQMWVSNGHESVLTNNCLFHCVGAGRDSSIGCMSAWFDPHIRQNSFVEFGHEIISTAILSLPLVQEGPLSVTGERMCTKYWAIA